MSESLMPEIIELGLELEDMARLEYIELSKTTEDKVLAKFWQGMASDETAHLASWKHLRKYAYDGMIPEIFEKPFQMRDELAALRDKIEALRANKPENPGVSDMFLLAYRLEFFLLHPAFITLFNFLKCIPGEKSPVDGYEEHLKFFIDAMMSFGGSTPELELLGETINHLWNENGRLALQSSTDELTGVLNRRGLFNAIRPIAYLAQRSGLEVGAIIVDIDDFKKVNDRFGHQQGDRVIAETARLLAKNVRHSDIIGRYGGEEFMIFLADSTKDAVGRLAEKLIKVVREHEFEGVSVTLSAGAAGGRIERDVEKELDELISRADKNLYRAKERGKNCVEADPSGS